MKNVLHNSFELSECLISYLGKKESKISRCWIHYYAVFINLMILHYDSCLAWQTMNHHQKRNYFKEHCLCKARIAKKCISTTLHTFHSNHCWIPGWKTYQRRKYVFWNQCYLCILFLHLAREFLKKVWGLEYKSNNFSIQMKTFRIKRKPR